MGAARPLPPNADIGPGGQSVGQAAQVCLCLVEGTASHDVAQIERSSPRAGVLSYAAGWIMPDTRNTLFVMAAGAGFFLAMYQWVSMIAEAMP